MKRTMRDSLDYDQLETVELEDNMDLGSPRVPETHGGVHGGVVFEAELLYHDTLQRNNPNMHMDMRENPMWCYEEFDDVSEDDEPPEEEDPTCPTILLTAQEKRMLREL